MAPANVTVSLAYGPPQAAPAPEQPRAAELPAELLAIAEGIAVKADPQRTDVYFETKRRALSLPDECGTTAQDGAFIAQYRLAFDHARPRLTATNVGPFFAGMCQAWGDAVQRGTDAAAQSQAERAKVIAHNFTERAKLALQKAVAKQIRNVALFFMLAAFAAFLTVALLLAFLAMEGHSRALRAAVESLAADKAGGARSAA